jgi:hypothetical protein
MIFRVLLKFDNYIVIMDHMCVGRVILIWMLFSVIKEPYMTLVPWAHAPGVTPHTPLHLPAKNDWLRKRTWVPAVH